MVQNILFGLTVGGVMGLIALAWESGNLKRMLALLALFIVWFACGLF